MQPGQDPAEKLKDIIDSISGFSLKHLMTLAKRHQQETEKPIHMSFVPCGPAGKRYILFSPAEGDAAVWHPDETGATVYCYDLADFLPLLSCDHGNKAMMDQPISDIAKLLEVRQTKPSSDVVFTIPVKFLQTEAYTNL
jgi:hypothetical protein